jgi:hypothetical protein
MDSKLQPQGLPEGSGGLQREERGHFSKPDLDVNRVLLLGLLELYIFDPRTRSFSLIFVSLEGGDSAEQSK